MNALLLWISLMATGVSLYCLMWVILRPATQSNPDTKTTRHGTLMTLSWPWIVVLSALADPFISWPLRRRADLCIMAAGLQDDGLLPRHVVAMQLLALLLGCLFFTGLFWASFGMTLTQAVIWALLAGLCAMWWPWLWLRDLGRKRQLSMLREFPFLLDMTTLCVEAGLNLQGALQQAAQHGPEGPLRAELRRCLTEMRAGASRLQALNDMASRTGLPAVRSLVTALIQADQLGMSLGPLLRSQSEQRRSERYLRAEKLALEAPVKMLFPMVCCIFPCTFLVIGFPIVMKLTESGL